WRPHAPGRYSRLCGERGHARARCRHLPLSRALCRRASRGAPRSLLGSAHLDNFMKGSDHMRMTRRSVIATGAAASASLFAPALIRSARAARRLTVASLLAAGKPETKIWLRIGEIVEERLPGAFSFNVVEN